MSRLFDMLSRFVIAFLLRNKHLLISWLQSLSAVILASKKIKGHKDSFSGSFWSLKKKSVLLFPFCVPTLVLPEKLLSVEGVVLSGPSQGDLNGRRAPTGRLSDPKGRKLLTLGTKAGEETEVGGQ